MRICSHSHSPTTSSALSTAPAMRPSKMARLGGGRRRRGSGRAGRCGIEVDERACVDGKVGLEPDGGNTGPGAGW